MPHDREVRTIDELVRRISEAPPGIVTFDGYHGIGKSTLTATLAHRLSVPAIKVDGYLNKGEEAYVGALQGVKLRDAISSALATHSVALVDGVCMASVLQVIGMQPTLTIYVQRNSRTGIPCDQEVLDMEDGIELDPYYTTLITDDLDVEVFAYHKRYRPRANADIVYVHTWNE
ncbi:hypothetical protein [Burkholderia contaminans]|uniref:hypothetical protein n=1 Tax=Burkholderia contaminans TaxID=488447 RepID=UPI0019109189|nr:hypothetical protein [Burkholderia contaminans]MEB4632282.1 hypothetical protein [Burkholderia contaminans]MEB4639569.1 hypothetical protein [Burkholderia contaminans]MEB4654225.1 hypothetical protein [Burkholderia contaminans]MEB4663486.1 hypothetical protein [Burkholderia contaminans]MEB4669467.1 hypothetical protein [Burkholderia contaminans]